jgi:hypothetical protein
VIEIILQHRESGLFLGANGSWSDLSRNALIFSSATEALRFANESQLSAAVRAVVRVQRERHYILMPLLDFSDDAAAARSRKRL